MAKPTRKTSSIYISSELHRRMKKKAIDKNMKLQELVESALTEYLSSKKSGDQPCA